jgi:ubiquinol-cytochrome c reductase cytochrome b subunit
MAANAGNTSKRGGVLAWFEERLPIRLFIETQLTGYFAPKNFTFWYYFGVLALVLLVLQYTTGIFLAMFYKPGAATAFDSVQYIMRDVEWGWLIRYAHSTGASFFFIVVYMHMFRALLYGSYRAPRELLWLFGMLLYVSLMAEAFLGYVLPWGNMSFWGAQVIVSLFGTIPGVGPELAEWIRGDYVIADATLNRFFALHVVAIPMGLLLLVVLHLVALRSVGSNNPDGVEKGPTESVPYHPYYTVADVVAVAVFLVVFATIVFFAPTVGGLFLEMENYEPADPLSTPEHIAPVWYFTPYYAILRAIPDQRIGALLMFLAVASFLLLPWLDRSQVRSMRYKGWPSRFALTAFAISFVALGYLGLQPAEGENVVLARAFTVIYFAYFWLMPVYTRASLDRGWRTPESSA